VAGEVIKQIPIATEKFAWKNLLPALAGVRSIGITLKSGIKALDEVLIPLLV
jgi:hypothetical protein